MSLTPKFGITKMPSGEKANRYPDIDYEQLIGSIETEGVRLAWSRAASCPCIGDNDQTRQPEINCTLCDGHGLIHFGPRNYAAPKEAGTLTDVQKALLADDGAALIRGIVGRATQRGELYDTLGRWMWGAMYVTVRPENVLGYYDRLVSLDSEVAYYQNVDVKGGAQKIPLRYLATAVNHIRSPDKVFRENADYTLKKDGTLEWAPGKIPSLDTRISVHYLMHPTWIVSDHPHVLREIARRNVPGRKQTTPLGTPTPLPIQARIDFEFRPGKEE